MAVNPTVEILIDGVWTDVSDQVLNDQRLTIRRHAGWRAVDSTVEAGTCAFVLDNPTAADGGPGPWSHLHPSSTYYGRVGLGTQTRCSASGSRRFWGEICSLRPGADSTGRHGFVEVEARGGLGRHIADSRPLRSPAYRALMAPANDATRIAVWPLEEESTATGFLSASGASRIQIVGEVSAGAFTGAPSTERMPTMGAGGQLVATVPAYTGTGEMRICALWNIPSGSDEPPTDSRIMRVHLQGGTVDWVDLRYNTGGVLRCDWYVNNFLYVTTPNVSFGATVFGQDCWIALEFAQVGGDISSKILAVAATTTGVSLTGTVTGQTLGTVRQVVVGQTSIDGVSVGQLAVGSDTSTFENFRAVTFSGGTGIRGFFGESAVGRIFRLATEAGVSSGFRFVARNADGMGVQSTAALGDLWDEAAQADGGMLFDSRNALQLVYIDRLALMNQLPLLTLDYAASQLHAHLVPAADDRLTRNDVTVTREGGGSGRYVIPDGDPYHHTQQDPPDGIGPYAATLTLAVQSDLHTGPQAGWYAHLGAAKDPRFGEVVCHLHASAFTSDAGLLAEALAVDAGHVIAVDQQPSWCPPDPVRLLVHGLDEDIDTDRHIVRWAVQPAYPWEVWILDSGGSTLAVAVDDNDVSWKLAQTGLPWSTDNEPYHLSVEGEAVTVGTMVTDTPAFIAAGTVAHADNASVVPGLPAGMTVDVGQLMVLVAAIRSSGTGTVNQPAGWATISGASDNFRIMTKYYVTGDTAPTVTFAGGAAGDTTSARIVAFSGLSRHLDGATSTQLNSSAQDIAIPALSVYPSTTGGHRRTNDVAFVATWKQDDCTDVATPAGFTQAFDSNTTTGNDQSIALFYRIDTAAAAVAAQTLTVTGGAAAISRGKVWALRPLQTATVTRSVNGVSASHAAAAAVYAWRPGAIAL